MAKKDETKVENETVAATEASDGPLLDLNDAAVKRMIKLAKKRGFVTYAELNAVLPSEEVSSDQIEDVYAMLSEMGITVSEGDDPDDVEAEEQAAEEEEPEGGELVESPRATAVATRTSEPADRTDDPVRMYLREMGSVELLSREGEIAIAKRIEEGLGQVQASLGSFPWSIELLLEDYETHKAGKKRLAEIVVGFNDLIEEVPEPVVVVADDAETEDDEEEPAV
ncbi:RNA polymerase sigma factor region1.1 domain-containing protein, partial [Methylocystis sp.]|uniref:RNA polymerase sigma factor region1.1 domain-containing protein n=1 Tax=Methylocystis sp. TaxID=1911079 RepID=UPI003DA247FD